MAYLAMNGKVAAVITEDSDLLLFGCPRVVFKLDKNGYGEQIVLESLGNCKEMPLYNLSFKQFRQMCILSGCDYLPSVVGMGLKTAHRHITSSQSIDRLLKAIRVESMRKVPMPEGYEKAFFKAELTFMHQMVFDAERGRLTHLTPISEETKASLLDDWSFLGAYSFAHSPLCAHRMLDDDIARQIAVGCLHPTTFLPFVTETKPEAPAKQIIMLATGLQENAAPSTPPVISPYFEKHGSAERLTLKRTYSSFASEKAPASLNSRMQQAALTVDPSRPPLVLLVLYCLDGAAAAHSGAQLCRRQGKAEDPHATLNSDQHLASLSK